MRYIQGPVRLGDWEISIEWFGPKEAREALSNQATNRTIRSKNAKSYARAMLAGEWSLTHQGVAFDEKGIMIDGQHRMTAIIKSGEEQMFLVFRGLKNSCFHVLDQGARRTGKDILGLMSPEIKEFRAQLATVAKFVLFGGMRNARTSMPGLRDVHIARYVTDNIEQLLPYVRLSRAKDTRAIFSSGWTGAFCSAAALYGNDEIMPLAKRLQTLAWTDDKDPIKALYVYMVNNKGLKKTTFGLKSWGCVAYYATTSAILACRKKNPSLSAIRLSQKCHDIKGIDSYRKEQIDRLKSLKFN